MKDVMRVVLAASFCAAVLIIAVLFPALASAHDDVVVYMEECGQPLAAIAQIDNRTYVVRRGDAREATELATALAQAPDTITVQFDVDSLRRDSACLDAR